MTLSVSNNLAQSSRSSWLRGALPVDERRFAATLVVSAAMHAMVMAVLHAMPAVQPAPTVTYSPVESAPIPVAFFDVVEEPAPDEVAEITPPEPVEEVALVEEAAPEAAPEPATELVDAQPPVPAPPERGREPAPEPVVAVAEHVPADAFEPIGESDDGPAVAAAPRAVDPNADAPAEPTPSPAVPAVAAVAANLAAEPSEANPPVSTAAHDPDADVGAIRARYHRQLTRRLARLQNGYTPTLQRLRLEGTVVVVIELDDRGRIVAVSLAESSGDDRLDSHAIDQVRRLRRLVEPPHALGVAARTVELPISYSIRA